MKRVKRVEEEISDEGFLHAITKSVQEERRNSRR
jgi:hypothetical protein